MNTTIKRPPLHILLADDGSQHSLAACTLLSDLPLPESSMITIMAVLTPRNASNHATRQESAEQKRELFTRKPIDVKTELLVGEPAETVVEYANKHSTDLIVMGAKGLRATLGILLGGVAQQVVEYANRPVLIVRAPYRRLRRIMLIIDGSAYGQAAVSYMQKFPLPPESLVYLTHVLPPMPVVEPVVRTWPVGAEPIPTIPVTTQEEIQARREEEERIAQTLLEKAGEELLQSGLKVTQVLLRGDAATEIIEYVKTHEIDIIVAGSRGLSRIKSWLLGSLSRKLVHYAPCSVMIVRSQTLE